MKSSIWVVTALAALVTWGCSCSDSNKPACPEPGPECCMTDMDCTGPDYAECCLVTHECIALPDDPGEEDDGCDPGHSCDDLLDIVLIQGETEEEGCLVDWSCCEPRDDLAMGKIGTHTGMDVASDGTIWLSGYAAGTDESHTYGDLASGMWDDTELVVEWELLDGVPWDVEPYAPPDGFRGGINEPGDDIGLYTQLSVDGSDAPRVAYHDLTNGALKYVTRDGGSWNDPQVIDGDSAGTYGSMVLHDGDVPAVAYRAQSAVLEDYEGVSYQVGVVYTTLRYAVADDSTASSWAVQDVVDMATPCWGLICPEDHRCRLSDGLCWPEDDEQCPDDTGSYSCGADEACVERLDDAGVPQGTYHCDGAVAIEPVLDLPEGIAIWNSLALGPDGIPEVVYYDRTNGELHWVAGNATGWDAPVIVDGDDTSGDEADHGDKGWNPSLAIDGDGTRHIAYVDGLAETLMYAQIDSAGAIVVREVVDDGTSAGLVDASIVGDYADIAVDGDGRVRLAYQNTTEGYTMLAVRGAASGAWTIAIASDPGGGFMGYYINQRIVDGASVLAQFNFNYEVEPFYRGIVITSCSVGLDDTITCD